MNCTMMHLDELCNILRSTCMPTCELCTYRWAPLWPPKDRLRQPRSSSYPAFRFAFYLCVSSTCFSLLLSLNLFVVVFQEPTGSFSSHWSSVTSAVGLLTAHYFIFAYACHLRLCCYSSASWDIQVVNIVHSSARIRMMSSYMAFFCCADSYRYVFPSIYKKKWFKL